MHAYYEYFVLFCYFCWCGRFISNAKTGKEARAQLLSSSMGGPLKEPFRSLGFIFHEIFAERTQKAAPKRDRRDWKPLVGNFLIFGSN